MRERQDNAGVMAMAIVVAVTVVVTIMMSAVAMPVMAILMPARVIRTTVAAIVMPPFRGKRRRGEGQGGDQQCDSKSLDAIHGKSPIWLRTG